MSEKVTRFYDKAAKFEVRETNDYGKFKKLLGNREVQEKRISQLMVSIKENGFLNSSIIVNENMEVIDGQARCEALKRLGMPIYYCIHKGAGLKECVDLNIKQGNWTLADYCGSYAANGNLNYIRLAKLMDELKTQYSSCYAIAWGRIASCRCAVYIDSSGQRCNLWSPYVREAEGTHSASAVRHRYPGRYRCEDHCPRDGKTGT